LEHIDPPAASTAGFTVGADPEGGVEAISGSMHKRGGG